VDLRRRAAAFFLRIGKKSARAPLRCLFAMSG
jgi:hypothetical protein